MVEVCGRPISDVWLDQIGVMEDFFWYVSSSHGRSGGILVGVKNSEYEVLEVEQGIYFVRCLVIFFFDGFKRNLVIVYGVAQMSGKEAFVREFAQL
jgi:hypothetical protein